MANSQYKNCNLLLDELMKAVQNTQMQREEYAYIASFLKQSNFLVFGTGFDSDYWRCVNDGGFTAFLEDDEEWIDDAKSDIYKIEYSTTRKQHAVLLQQFKNKNYTNLELDVPMIIRQTKWDVILVDAPVGNSDDAPGRMQSIYTAQKLANPKTHVFVHDCNREVENIYTKTMFKHVVKDLFKLRHLRK